MHHKNEVTKIIQEITAGQGLEIDFEIGLIHQLMDDYAESSSDTFEFNTTALSKSDQVKFMMLLDSGVEIKTVK